MSSTGCALNIENLIKRDKMLSWREKSKKSITCCVLIIENLIKVEKGQNVVLMKKKDVDNKLCVDYCILEK